MTLGLDKPIRELEGAHHFWRGLVNMVGWSGVFISGALKGPGNPRGFWCSNGCLLGKENRKIDGSWWNMLELPWWGHFIGMFTASEPKALDFLEVVLSCQEAQMLHASIDTRHPLPSVCSWLVMTTGTTVQRMPYLTNNSGTGLVGIIFPIAGHLRFRFRSIILVVKSYTSCTSIPPFLKPPVILYYMDIAGRTLVSITSKDFSSNTSATAGASRERRRMTSSHRSDSGNGPKFGLGWPTFDTIKMRGCRFQAVWVWALMIWHGSLLPICVPTMVGLESFTSAARISESRNRSQDCPTNIQPYCNMTTVTPKSWGQTPDSELAAKLQCVGIQPPGPRIWVALKWLLTERPHCSHNTLQPTRLG